MRFTESGLMPENNERVGTFWGGGGTKLGYVASFGENMNTHRAERN